MRTLILCGGRGVRAHPLTADLPKPLLQVGGRPVLRHVMDRYADQGHCDFVLAAGYRIDDVRAFAADLPAAWSVTVVDTGEDTGTAARLAACRSLVDGTCFATYGDGVGDVDLEALLATHRAHPGDATVTAVPLRSQFGTLDIADDGRVRRFVEKPVLADHWINAGFFVLEPTVLDDRLGDDLEREVLPALAEAGRLFVHRHPGFWRSLDTAKDLAELDELFAEGAPWRS